MIAITPLNEDRAKEVTALKAMLRGRGVSIKRLRKALRDVVSYMGNDEEEDFLQADHTASLDQHIYGSIIIIEEYLKGKR